MTKENNILSNDFLDFDIFALPDDQFSDFEANGSNHSKTLVVYESEVGSEDLESFLKNILTAAKLDTSKEVHLIKLTDLEAISFIRLQTKAQFEKAILFGVSPNKLGITLDLKPYQPFPFQACTFLLAEKLSTVKNDVNKKRALWNCLQEIYLK